MSQDGYLTIVDRKKDMIKTGGENVASREVEEAVYQMDGVAEVAVFGVAHPRWVEAVVAVVVPKPAASLTEEAVIRHTRGLLAGYKTPKRVVIADAIPKNPSGKILKRQLREKHKDLAADTRCPATQTAPSATGGCRLPGSGPAREQRGHPRSSGSGLCSLSLTSAMGLTH